MCLYHPFNQKTVASAFYLNGPFVGLTPDAERLFTPAQKKILTAVRESGLASDLVITCVNAPGGNGFHTQGAAMDFGVQGQTLGRNRKHLWNLYFYLKDSLNWGGGLGLGAIGNPHVHVDDRSNQYQWFELATRRRPDGSFPVREISALSMPQWRAYRAYYTGSADPDPSFLEGFLGNAPGKKPGWTTMDFVAAGLGAWVAWKLYRNRGSD